MFVFTPHLFVKVGRGSYILIMLFVFVVHCGVQHVLIRWVTWWESYMRQGDRNCLSFANTWVHPRCFGGSALLIILVFCVVLLRYGFGVMMSVTISAYKLCSGRLYLKLFLGGLMSYLRYLCLLAFIGVQHILCCVVLRLVYHMLLVSLDCPFLIVPSVFSNVYLLSTKHCIEN